MNTVFHTVLWTESERDITMSLGIEGSIASREVAERCAETYRECLQIGYEVDGDPTKSFRSRVGILEIPAPDSRLGHPDPRSDVDEIMKEIRTRFARKARVTK